jgi:hypothetical protein
MGAKKGFPQPSFLCTPHECLDSTWIQRFPVAPVRRLQCAVHEDMKSIPNGHLLSH